MGGILSVRDARRRQGKAVQVQAYGWATCKHRGRICLGIGKAFRQLSLDNGLARTTRSLDRRSVLNVCRWPLSGGGGRQPDGTGRATDGCHFGGTQAMGLHQWVLTTCARGDRGDVNVSGAGEARSTAWPGSDAALGWKARIQGENSTSSECPQPARGQPEE